MLDEFGSVIVYLDMGWEDVKVVVEYDGEQHWNVRAQRNRDIRRLGEATAQGPGCDPGGGGGSVRRDHCPCPRSPFPPSVKLDARSSEGAGRAG